MLAASFAACGLLLFVLFVAVVGCTGEPFRQGGRSSANVAILCGCDCYKEVQAISVPIAAGPDDVVQGSTQATAVLNSNQLELGMNNHVGLRFQPVGIPKGATVTYAYIQFTATQGAMLPTSLWIHVVPNAAPFTTATDLTAFTGMAPIAWQPGVWTQDEMMDNEQTPDLAALLNPIVQDSQYDPDSAVAFIISGSGQRIAFSFDAAKSQAPFLGVKYLPTPIHQDFLACGDPAQADLLCEKWVKDNVTQFANACSVGSHCTCVVKPGADPSKFSSTGCDVPCAAIHPPEDCDPEGIAKTEGATAWICWAR